jgi:hypothetical protein
MIGQVLGVVGIVVGIVVFLGAVTVYLRGSYDTGTIATLRRNNDALTERVSLLEKSEHDLLIRVESAEREVKRLETQRPSAEVLAAMSDFLQKHDKTAREILAIVKNGNGAK